MATEAIVNAIDDATTEIDQALTKCNAAALAELPALKKAVTLAAGVSQLRKVLTDNLVEKVFVPLMGTPLGFCTDRDDKSKPEYPLAVIRDCMIEGMIRGLQPVNNEINIISGRCYATKNGLRRLVSTWPGLTDLAVTPGVPVMAGEKGAVIAMRATWRLHGQPMELVRSCRKNADGEVEDNRIAVRVNAGMGADAIIGKAERKLFKAIYDLISGSTLTLIDGEAESIDTIGEAVAASSEPTPAPAPPAQDGKRISLKRNGGGAKVEQPPLPEQPRMREPGEEG